MWMTRSCFDVSTPLSLTRSPFCIYVGSVFPSTVVIIPLLLRTDELVWFLPILIGASVEHASYSLWLLPFGILYIPMLCTGHNHRHTGYLLVDITYLKKLCYISFILKRRHKFSQSLATAQSDITKICPSNLVPFHHYRWKIGCFFGWHPIKLWRGRLILLIWSGLDSMFKSI